MGPGSKQGVRRSTRLPKSRMPGDAANPLLPPHKTLEPGLSEWEHRGRHNSLLFLSLRVERETDGEMDGAKTKSWKRLQNVIGTICVLRPRQTKHKTLRTDSGAFPRRLEAKRPTKDMKYQTGPSPCGVVSQLCNQRNSSEVPAENKLSIIPVYEVAQIYVTLPKSQITPDD